MSSVDPEQYGELFHLSSDISDEEEARLRKLARSMGLSRSASEQRNAASRLIEAARDEGIAITNLDAIALLGPAAAARYMSTDRASDSPEARNSDLEPLFDLEDDPPESITDRIQQVQQERLNNPSTNHPEGEHHD